MPVYKAEAIILRRRVLGEADRVLTLFTREHGKFSALARGVRRTSSKLAGRLEPFSHVALLLGRGRGSLDVVAQAEVVTGLGTLRSDLRLFGRASLVAELVEAAVPEREPHPEVFALLRQTLDLLATDAPALPWFALQLIALVGFDPALHHCAVCRGDLGGAAAWSHPLGGLVDARCAARDPAAVRLRPEMVRALRALRAADAGAVPTVTIAPRGRSLLLEILRRYAEHRLEVRLRAPAVLGQIPEAW